MIRGFIGMLHLPPLPGDALHRGPLGLAQIETKVMRDAERLVEGGVDALLLENFGSVPFYQGSHQRSIPPHQIAALSILSSACQRRFGVPVGVNCLRNDPHSALGIAAIANASFIRVNVHIGAYVTDQGLIQGEAAETLAYRRQLNADHVAILADVLVKHASPLGGVSAIDATRDVIKRGLADGVIVTGDHTGGAVEKSLLEEVREGAQDHPIFIGSGLTPERAHQLAGLADGAIVGSWLKTNGDVSAPVDQKRVEAMAAALKETLWLA